MKPDGVNRGLVGEIIRRFEQKGFKLVGLKLIRPATASDEPSWQQAIADQLADIIVRRQSAYGDAGRE